MCDLSYSEVIRVLNSLIGKTNPIGSTHIDTERDTNFDILTAVTEWCLDGIREVAQNDGIEYSIQRMSEKAQRKILEYIEMLNEWMKERGGYIPQ